MSQIEETEHRQKVTDVSKYCARNVQELCKAHGRRKSTCMLFIDSFVTSPVLLVSVAASTLIEGTPITSVAIVRELQGKERGELGS